MTNGGNRYSTDGSYDLLWDRRFPIDGDRLWPSGRLLQLQRLQFSAPIREPRHIIILTKERLTIAEQLADVDPPWGLLDDGNGYRFYNGELKNEHVFDNTSIVKVALMNSFSDTGLAIRVNTDEGKTNKVFRSYGIGLSRVQLDVMDESIRKGVVDPGHALIPQKALYKFHYRFVYRQLERQFRRGVPQAEYVLKGDIMPLEDFARIVR